MSEHPRVLMCHYGVWSFSGFCKTHCDLSPKVVVISADPHCKAQQLPWGEAGCGGVPQRQADTFQGLPEIWSGGLGEETYRTGPVFCHQLSQHQWPHSTLFWAVEKVIPFSIWEEMDVRNCGFNIPLLIYSLMLAHSASMRQWNHWVSYATLYRGLM